MPFRAVDYTSALAYAYDGSLVTGMTVQRNNVTIVHEAL